MKHLLILIIVVMLFMSGCGKKTSEPLNENPAIETQQNISSEKENGGEPDKNSASESDNSALNDSFYTEFESMVDEFNTTDDPERKEELRSELEKILAEAEEAYSE